MRARIVHAALVGFAALVGLTAAGAAGAGELRLGAEGNYTFNSNFFSATSDPDPANSFQLGPTIRLEDEEGRFRYEIDFAGAYQTYADQDGVDAWESRLRTRLSWELSERTRIRLTDRFRDISNLRFSRQDIVVADTALDPNQDRYLRNDLDLELFHDLGELAQLRLRGSHRWVDFRQNRDRNDSMAWEAAGELRLQLAPTHAVGLGVGYVHQDYEEALARFGSTADYVNLFANWTWNVLDNVTLTANGGPSWVRSEEDDDRTTRQTTFVGGELNGEVRRAQLQACNPPQASNCLLALGSNPASDLGSIETFVIRAGDPRIGIEEAITFFGGVGLDATFDDWNLQLAYQRRQSTTSGDGLASSLDRVTTEVEWAPRRLRWSFFVAGSWDRRETLTDSTVIDFDLDTSVAPTDDAARLEARTRVSSRNSVRDNYTAIAGARYRLDEWLSATLDGRYRRTEIATPGPDPEGIDTIFVVLTFAFELAPIAY